MATSLSRWMTLVLALVIGGPALGQPSSPQGAAHGGVVVVPPRTDPVVASMAPGISLWLHRSLSESEVEVLPHELAWSKLKGGPWNRTHLARIGAHTGATHALFTDILFERGQVDVRLRVYEVATGDLLAATREGGPLGNLGGVLHGATIDLLQGVGFSPEKVKTQSPPRLTDLSAYSRARALLREARVTDAWRELEGRSGPTVDVLRARTETLARSRKIPVAERARFKATRGEFDRDWLRVRDKLGKTQDVATLIAGADVALSRNNTAQAVELFGEAVRIAPDNAEAHLGRGRALEVAKHYPAAREAYQRAAELDAENPAPLVALANLPDTQAEERARWLLRAGELQAGRFEAVRAQENFREAATHDHDVAALAYRRVAAVDERLGNHAEALLSYEQSAELDPEQVETLSGLGRARRTNGDGPGAESALRGAIERDDDHAESLRELGDLYTESGDTEKALPLLERAMRVEPDHSTGRRALARALDASGDPGRAVSVLQREDSDSEPSAAELHDAARIHAALGETEKADVLLERAVHLEPEDPDIHETRARVKEAQGDEESAAASRLFSAAFGAEGDGAEDPAEGPDARFFERLVSTFPTRNPETGRPIERVVLLGLEREFGPKGLVLDWVRPRTLDLGRLEGELGAALAERFELLPPPQIPDEVARDVEALRSFEATRGRIAQVNGALECDAVFAARVSGGRGDGSGGIRMEVRLFAGRESAGSALFANTSPLVARRDNATWNYKALAVYAGVLFLFTLPLRRGWGQLVVHLEYGSQGDGVFSIKLSKRPEKAKRERKSTGAHSVYQRRVRFAGRFQRFLAGPVTHFRWIPARIWHVAVHGVLQDAVTKQPIGNYFEEKRVEVVRGQVQEIHFDFRPREASVSLCVMEAEELAANAMVAIRGRSDTLRYIRDGVTNYHLDKGDYTILVGGRDRVLERRLEVHEFKPISLMVDIANDADCVFTECPGAVEPYLNGDLAGAAGALSEAGQGPLAHLLLAEFASQRGERDVAASHFESAGRFLEAAEQAAEGSDAERTAQLYEKAGEHGRAAEFFRTAGRGLEAGQAYESAYDYEHALECYREAGAREELLALLEKTSRHFEAAELALEADDVDRGIRHLESIDLRDHEYPRACLMLAKIFEDRGDVPAALTRIEEAVNGSGGDGAPLEMQERLAQLLEKVGRHEEALRVYRVIHEQDDTWPQVTQRIEELEQQVSQRDTGPTTLQTLGNDEGSRYEQIEEVGRGGMGVVYKARDRRLGRIVALKRLPDNLKNHPTAVELFLREARAAAALNHPNIVTLFDADQEEGNYFLTMEFLEGLPLNAIVKKRNRLSPRDVVRLGVQIAAGLQYAHDRGIVHRDIKTSNLFFTTDKVVKIMDFGLAKMVEEVRRATTVIGGTPYYMAPEQALGRGVDHRADLYALGVTFFELSTGQVPFREGDVQYHHRHTPPPDPRTIEADVPEALVDLILWMMNKDPANRPDQTGDVVQALQELTRSLAR